MIVSQNVVTPQHDIYDVLVSANLCVSRHIYIVGNGSSRTLAWSQSGQDTSVELVLERFSTTDMVCGCMWVHGAHMSSSRAQKTTDKPVVFVDWIANHIHNAGLQCGYRAPAAGMPCLK